MKSCGEYIYIKRIAIAGGKIYQKDPIFSWRYLRRWDKDEAVQNWEWKKDLKEIWASPRIHSKGLGSDVLLK